MASKALIWDLDGVIADTAPFHFRAWQRAAHDKGITFTETDFKQTFGKRNPEIIAEKFGPDISSIRGLRWLLRSWSVFRYGRDGPESSRGQQQA